MGYYDEYKRDMCVHVYLPKGINNQWHDVCCDIDHV